MAAHSERGKANKREHCSCKEHDAARSDCLGKGRCVDETKLEGKAERLPHLEVGLCRGDLGVAVCKHGRENSGNLRLEHRISKRKDRDPEEHKQRLARARDGDLCVISPPFCEVGMS